MLTTALLRVVEGRSRQRLYAVLIGREGLAFVRASLQAERSTRGSVLGTGLEIQGITQRYSTRNLAKIAEFIVRVGNPRNP